MLDISLKQLEVFVCVAELGSFSLAAEQLYLSQPTVSSHIAALEAVLNAPLLERGQRKKVTLTSRGQEVFRRCKPIVEGCRELETVCRSAACELHIGASTVPNEHILPGLMAAFRKQNPQCRFVVHKGNSAAIHELLAQGQLQLGIVGTVLDSERFAYKKLCEDALVLVTPNTPAYRKLQKQGVLGHTLLDRPLLVRTAGSGTQRAVERYLRENNIPAPPVVAQIESNHALLQSVAQGLGNAVLSELAAHDLGERLLCFPLEQERVTRELYLIYPKGLPLSALSQKFCSFALSYATAAFS